MADVLSLFHNPQKEVEVLKKPKKKEEGVNLLGQTVYVPKEQSAAEQKKILEDLFYDPLKEEIRAKKRAEPKVISELFHNPQKPKKEVSFDLEEREPCHVEVKQIASSDQHNNNNGKSDNVLTVERSRKVKQTSVVGQHPCGQLKENASYSKDGKQISPAGLYRQNKDGSLTIEQQIFIQGMLYQHQSLNAWYSAEGQQPPVTGQDQFEYNKDGSLSVEQEIFLQGMSYQYNYDVWCWQNYYGMELPAYQTELPSKEKTTSQDEAARNLC
ncbi:uncharacterized protein [Clytia hemisphaerica]|uniref:Uncharacterized protein n=1 Tax=Clytia hemisphaerica TaxID=252671 RepID=A0A7M5XIY7_9CNID